MSAPQGKVLSYDLKWFIPFEKSSIDKNVIPKYVWCIEPVDSELVILPTYGRSFDKIRYLYDKDGINVMTHAVLNEDGVIFYEQNNLCLFNLEDFASMEATIGYKKTNSITYNWFIDWSRGREDYKLVVDLNSRTFGYMDSRENYKTKRLSLCEAYLKKDVADWLINDLLNSIEALRKVNYSDEVIQKSSHFNKLKQFALLVEDSEGNINKGLKEQVLFGHASAAIKAKALVELGLDSQPLKLPAIPLSTFQPAPVTPEPVVEEVKPVVEEVKPVIKAPFTFKF